MIPYVNIAGQHRSLRDEILPAVERVLARGDFIFGKEVGEFEQRFAELCGVRYAVSVNSGTDALVLGLRALGIGAGNEVITAPNSFIASASCIALLGARPVFVDVREDYNLDPQQIQAAITPKTKAILPVHLTGRPADMDPIERVARKHGLIVIEDSAQAVLAEYKGRRVGSMGTIGCFSLHPLKTFSACGDGGVVTTNNEELDESLKLLRNHGFRTRDDCILWGVNSRLDTLQAAILLVKMKYLVGWTEKRRNNVRYYQKALSGVPGIAVPVDQAYERAVYHTFVLQANRRDELRQYLADHGVGTAVHYPVPIHLQKAAAELGYIRGSFPVAERQAERILSLPVYPELGESQLKHVTRTIRKFYDA